MGNPGKNDRISSNNHYRKSYAIRERLWTMKQIRTLIIAGILVAVATGYFGKKRRLTPRHVSLPPGGTVLPTRDCGDLFFVSAMINGLDGFNLILDTGTQGLTLSKEAVEKLWPGKSAGHVDELIVGEYTARDFSATLNDQTATSAVLGERIDGLLGFRVFADVLLTYDYPNRIVKLQHGSLNTKDDHVLRYSGGMRPFLPFQTAGMRKEFLLDTGSTGGISIPHLKKLSLEDKLAVVSVSATVRGAFLRKAARLRTDATWGPLHLSRPIVHSRNKKTHIIGCEIINRFALTFDQQNMLVRFIGPIHEIIEMDPLRTQGFIIAPKGDAYRVAYVIENSPADNAGIKVNDLLEAIDGKPLLIDCNWRNDRLKEQKTRTSSILTFKRDDRKWDVKLDYIDRLP